MRLRGWAVSLAVLAGPALAGTPDDPLRVVPDPEVLRSQPQLRARLLGSAHGYFRFLSAPFAREVCRRFQDVAGLPEATLHGDAHVEQYAVTSLGRGLTDVDDATRGPFVLDLVRFGVSLTLAARERGWPEEAEKSLDAFLRGYRQRLDTNRLQIPTPRAVTRLRATFKFDHRELLRQADAYMDAEPVPVEGGTTRFCEYSPSTMESWSGIPARFFALKKAGVLRIGIGSALDEKYLLRVEGWTEAEDDDVILEAKRVREQAGIECLRKQMGPDRVVTGNELIAYEPFPFSGLLNASGGGAFWLHAWPDDYRELSIATSLPSPRDLREVAFDVGVQLGRAHPLAMNATADGRVRRALRDASRQYEARIRAAVEALTDEVVAAWQEFRRVAGS